MAQRDDANRLIPGEPATNKKPKITREMRANAKANPNSWLYVIDEAFDPNGRVPSWAVVGAYPVNADGEIVEDFHPNDRYRPSPKALGFPEPDNHLERLLQLVRTRHRPAEDLPPVILDSTLFVYAMSPVQRTVIGFHNTDGRVMVPAYTSKSLVPEEWPHARAVLGRDIVELLAGHPLVINPHDIVTAVVPAEHLQQALDQEH
ncbi:type III secretion system (T3SS) SseB-like protein [Prauserella shujinwangii]|uniref:Type III secretion system (T3SS) SseB-like protein n=1 Tax=Prauserella shujinwangii TaxID=1453103 RepID=A0A2T0LUD0_9PSEU|nr:type VII secretion system-associated protein [Prauserella shujinwangii]PRX47450.1 type III secretion system (T3SS) SseB-like protein [Prauserella shujinwangii]